jgi:proteasome lid subunit RPN8/RPN11
MQLEDLTEQTKQSIIEQGLKCSPIEACGFIVQQPRSQTVIHCKNIAGTQYGEDMFVLDGAAMAKAAMTGDIRAIYHTHPIGSSEPSYADRVGCVRSQIPWVVCSPLNRDFQIILPTDPLLEKPLLGRPFCWGIFDCYSLVQDYYKQEFNISLPDYDRGMLFQWDYDPQWNHFEDKFQDFGFYELLEGESFLQKGDIFLMSIGSRKINHCAVLHQPDRNIFYHHLLDHLSEAAVYGGQWRMLTRKILRHRDV